MKYAIQITPDRKVEIKEYADYHTINDLVDGWYERCGILGILNKMCMIFCNEEFLFQDNCKFNPVGSALAAQPIYGNIVVLLDGYNDEEEHDCLPMDYDTAQKISATLQNMIFAIETTLNELSAKYGEDKPEPSFTIKAMSEKEFAEVMGLDKNDYND